MNDQYVITFAAGDPIPGRRKNVWDASAAPGASDDATRGLSVGSLWIDQTGETAYICADASAGAAVWVELAGGGPGGAPATADYLVGTAQGGLSAEIVVGTTPAGELGGTWGTPTVDATHSGSSHTGTQAAAEATVAAALSGHEGAADPHAGYQRESEKAAASATRRSTPAPRYPSPRSRPT